MDVSCTYWCDHFAKYTNTESLCYTPEMDIMFYVNNISVKKTENLPILCNFFVASNEIE